jgi:hypothetical protein
MSLCASIGDPSVVGSIGVVKGVDSLLYVLITHPHRLHRQRGAGLGGEFNTKPIQLVVG